MPIVAHFESSSGNGSGAAGLVRPASALTRAASARGEGRISSNGGASGGSSGGGAVPSWLTAWSRPVVNSTPIDTGPAIKDFTAKPLPASSRAGGLGPGLTLGLGGVQGAPGSSSPTNTSPRFSFGVRSNSLGRPRLSSTGDDADAGGGGNPGLSSSGGALAPTLSGPAAHTLLGQFARGGGGGGGGGGSGVLTGLPPTPPQARPGSARRAGRASFSGGSGPGPAPSVAPGGGPAPSAAWGDRPSGPSPPTDSGEAATGPGARSGSGERRPSSAAPARRRKSPGMPRRSHSGGGGGGAHPTRRQSHSGGAGSAPPARRASLTGGALTADPAAPPHRHTSGPRKASSKRGSLSGTAGAGKEAATAAAAAASPPAPRPGAAAPGRQRPSSAAPARASASGAAQQPSPSPPPRPSAPHHTPSRPVHESPKRRPRVALEALPLGPDEGDSGDVTESQLLTNAARGFGRAVSGVPNEVALPGPGPSSVSAFGLGPDRPERAPALHIPLPQHMLMNGTLTDLVERLARGGERSVHLSLASVAFSGELDASLGDTIRITNRLVILHNATFHLRPGQSFWVGPGGFLLLADVLIITSPPLAAAVTSPVPSRGTSRRGKGSLGASAAAAPPPPPPWVASLEAASAAATPPPVVNSAPWAAPRFGGDGGGGGGFGGGAAAAPRPGAIASGVPLLHVVSGGKLLLRGCRVKVMPTVAAEAAAPPTGALSLPPGLTPGVVGGGGGGGSTLTSPRGGGGGGGERAWAAPPAPKRPSPSQMVCVLAEAGAAVEAMGCRLGRIVAAGAGANVALRRCRVKPGKACSPDAPLALAADGASLSITHTELKGGPAQAVALTGAGSRLHMGESAISLCRSHGVMASAGASVTAAACRITLNGGAGVSARGATTSLNLEDCELVRNGGSGVSVGGGASARVVSSLAVQSRGGSGLSADGAGTRVVAESCSLDDNAASGVTARRGACVELVDCSASGNVVCGLEVEGTYSAGDAAQRVAEATLAGTPTPPAPSPAVINLVRGGVFAKNHSHGVAISNGGGLKVLGAELSQNGGDGAYVDGGGCELALQGCSALGNVESALFVCSGGGARAEACRLGGNLHGDVAVGGKGSRAILDRCQFEWNPVTALRVHMGAAVVVKDCAMEPQPTSGVYAAAHAAVSGAEEGQGGAKGAAKKGREPDVAALLDDLGEEEEEEEGAEEEEIGGGVGSWAGGAGKKGWAIGSVKSEYVQLFGRGSSILVDGQMFISHVGEDGEPLMNVDG
ncbi:hypothetical protein HYH03_015993 [Edaphochlamys debaryana]|uniref:Right handed beta helix domain-containing protein n=1 Tax=Edaphochlamys debaryana TaxID=47281 RepID=A0A835XJX3_9CHLO|nr:hypothetical protein HYH03_015993 [Edaphochlamys debaryana]|eukprot:KAG2485206.1 hypothetical protein HYH03_015993 [Edaphochlamys debaryana]